MISRIGCLVLVALSVGCADWGRNAMIGRWESGPSRTEWGEVVFTLELRSEGECEMQISPTVKPKESPLTLRGKWVRNGATNATVVWSNDKPDAKVHLSLVNATTLTFSGGEEVIRFTKTK